MTDDEQQKLTVMMVELSSKVQILLDKQEELAENISKIKEAVYNPDSGLYARIRALELWKESTSRVQWLVTSGVIMLLGKMVWDVMTAGGAG